MLLNVPASAQELEGRAEDEAQEYLEELLMGQRLVANVPFPAQRDGIDLQVDGCWDQGDVTCRIKDHGVGLEIDEPALVTDVKLRSKHIEIHVNGGGYGTFGDSLLSGMSPTGQKTNKRSAGSRINLRFDRDITAQDIDAAKLPQWLAPLVNTTASQRQAAMASIPEEFRDEASRGEVVVGMSKETVFAILREPVQKHVDLAQTPPVERWQ